ncbi:hypothetical protein D9758_009815 [Tetrapyrgos nigripes]|uniref:Helicase C-terminal domain-containing protein n=1 Tax=Tetrapyrgos nigripes TaxID=182062 RepID=A0A8H5GMJ4_9AGAR|nr:hypothetical protein D9758_009815 [Tetrapyrgos nigripes]
MSDTYLRRAHEEFTKLNGICKILVATAGEGTGIDHPDVEIVCIAGLPSDVHNIAQWGGRAVRQISANGLCVLFHEKWALKIDLSDYSFESDSFSLDSIDFSSFDVNRPRRLVLTEWSPPADRASFACVVLTRNLFCVCRFIARCLRDNTPESIKFSTLFCCFFHSANFDLQNFLQGKLWDGIEMTPDTTPSTLPKPKSRSGKKQRLLEKKFEAWRLEMHQAQPWPPRPVYYILPDSHIKLLAASLTHLIRSTHDLIGLTGQSVEWGQRWGTSLCKLVMEFDCMEEMVRSPEFIEESDCDEDQWEDIFAQDQKTRERTDNCALKAMGTDRYETDKRRRNVFFEITNE